MQYKEAFSYLKKKYDLSSAEARSLIEFHLSRRFEEILSATETIPDVYLKRLEEDSFNVQRGYPLAYILNDQEFYKYSFYVDANVLIPRPETEFLIEKVLFEVARDSFKSFWAADLGAGSGCLGITLLLENPKLKLVFLENSPGAVAVLLRNLRKHKIAEERFKVMTQLGEVNDFMQGQKFDLVISNPPYIAKDDQRVEKSVSQYEPQEALYAEDAGLAYLKSWSDWSMHNLNERGKVYFEFGLGQQDELIKFSQQNAWSYRIEKDQYNKDRFWVLEK